MYSIEVWHVYICMSHIYVYMYYILDLISDDCIKENGFSDNSVYCIISVSHPYLSSELILVLTITYLINSSYVQYMYYILNL